MNHVNEKCSILDTLVNLLNLQGYQV